MSWSDGSLNLENLDFSTLPKGANTIAQLEDATYRIICHTSGNLNEAERLVETLFPGRSHSRRSGITRRTKRSTDMPDQQPKKHLNLVRDDSRNSSAENASLHEAQISAEPVNPRQMAINSNEEIRNVLHSTALENVLPRQDSTDMDNIDDSNNQKGNKNSGEHPSLTQILMDPNVPRAHLLTRNAENDQNRITEDMTDEALSDEATTPEAEINTAH